MEQQLNLRQLRGVIRKYKTKESYKYVLTLNDYKQTFDTKEQAFEEKIRLNVQHNLAPKQQAIIHENYVEILLSNGQKCLVDNEDYEQLKQFSIFITAGYCCYKLNSKSFYIHRIITKAKQTELVDHISGDKNDNRRSNLRLTNQSVNSFNRKQTNNTSETIGVCFYNNKWHCQITIMGIKKRKKCETKEEAIQQRKQWESELTEEYQNVPNKQIINKQINQQLLATPLVAGNPLESQNTTY